MVDSDGVRSARCVYVRLTSWDRLIIILTLPADKRSQTPDLNTKPIIEAVIACVQRGIEVTLYITVGYNDAVRSETCVLLNGASAEKLSHFFSNRHLGRSVAVSRRNERRGY